MNIQLVGGETIMRVVVPMLFAELSMDFEPVLFINWFAYLPDRFVCQPTVIPFVLVLESNIVLLISITFDLCSIAVFGGTHRQDTSFSPFTELRVFCHHVKILAKPPFVSPVKLGFHFPEQLSLLLELLEDCWIYFHIEMILYLANWLKL